MRLKASERRRDDIAEPAQAAFRTSGELDAPVGLERPTAGVVEPVASLARSSMSSNAANCGQLDWRSVFAPAESLHTPRVPSSTPVASISYPSATGTAPLRIAQFLAASCIVLIPWTVGLALTLPRTYLVANWPLAWTGFDVILLGCLSTTAWALWKRRPLAVPAAITSAVLLLCDAWFDVVTAHVGRCLVISIGTAVFAEVPVALLLSLTALRLHRAGLPTAPFGKSALTQPLWHTPPLVTASTESRTNSARVSPRQRTSIVLDPN